MTDETTAGETPAEAPAEPKSDAPEPEETRAALIRLGLFAVVAIVASIYTNVLATVALIFALVIMIMIHELGHFLMAKWSGMKVTEFFLGFGPRLWSVRRGETEYGIKALPLGGYVKIIGMSSAEEVAPEDEERTYRRKSYRARFGVAVAGSFMHFVMAFVIYFILLAGIGTPAASNIVGSISPLQSGASPAQDAGLQIGDKVLTVDGQKVDSWVDDLVPYIQKHAGQTITLGIERNGTPMNLKATPVDRRIAPAPGETAAPGEPVGFIGIGPKRVNEREPVWSAFVDSGQQVGEGAVLVVKGLGKIFSPSGVKSYTETVAGTSTATPEVQAETRFLSPVGVGRAANEAANAGLREALLLLFIINLFVGVFNLTPLLPFDGGHIAIATYERIRSRRGKRYMADHNKFVPVTVVVLFVLGAIFVSSLYLDITDPLPNMFQ